MKPYKHIIITSIFPPTQAVNAFSELNGYLTIIVGDNKSPRHYENQKVIYLSVQSQKEFGFTLYEKLPFNHYCRKNIGYVYAIKNNAQIIIDTDDDNIPYPGWAFPEFKGLYETIEKNKGFINIYHLFCDQKIWPRGFPLQLLNTIKTYNQSSQFDLRECKIGVWQGLADEDPDVDAIYRLTLNEVCFFNKRAPVVLDEGTICPFNSQNTAFTKEMFPLLYLPSSVEFRYTDILRGLIAQPIMWLYGYKLGYTEATVIQKRNEHDYMKDFLSEVPMYLTSHSIVDFILGKINSQYNVAENLYLAYEALVSNKIVSPEELGLIKCWINDIG